MTISRAAAASTTEIRNGGEFGLTSALRGFACFPPGDVIVERFVDDQSDPLPIVGMQDLLERVGL